MGLRSSHSAPMAIEERLVSCAMSVNLLTSAPVFYSRSPMWIITWWASYCHSLCKISLCVNDSKYVCVCRRGIWERERRVHFYACTPMEGVRLNVMLASFLSRWWTLPSRSSVHWDFRISALQRSERLPQPRPTTTLSSTFPGLVHLSVSEMMQVPADERV